MIYSYNHICINILNLRIRDRCYELITAFALRRCLEVARKAKASWQPPSARRVVPQARTRTTPHVLHTAAVNAFNAEQRRRSSTPRAPDSVLGFAAAATGFRRPPTGTSTPASSCCRCPHHCVLPDGTYRIVRPAVEAHLAAVPDRDPEADVSEKTIRAYRVYKAAITDPTSSHADIDRLTRALKEQRQDDRERAQYYRMQEEEDAIGDCCRSRL